LYFVAGCCLSGDAIGIFLPLLKAEALSRTTSSSSISELPAKRLEPAMNSIKSVADGMTGRVQVSQHSPTPHCYRAAKQSRCFSRSRQRRHWHLDLDTGERWFHNGKAISDAKRLQAPVGIVVLKLVDEASFHSTKSSPLLVKSLRQDGVRF